MCRNLRRSVGLILYACLSTAAVAAADGTYAEHPVPLPAMLVAATARAERIAEGTFVQPHLEAHLDEPLHLDNPLHEVTALEPELPPALSTFANSTDHHPLVTNAPSFVDHSSYRGLVLRRAGGRRSVDTTEITEGDIQTCDQYAYMYRELGDGKPSTVTLGNNGDMSQMNCIVDVKNINNVSNGVPTETTTVVIDAASDTRNLQWRISLGRIEILDLGGGPAFRLVHIGLGHYEIHFGLGDNEVIHLEASGTTVAGLFFPSVSAQMNHLHRGNLVRIYKSKAGIFVSGNTDVQIGFEATTGWSGMPINPFTYITSVIAIAGSKDASATQTKVILETGKENIPHAAPSQHYGISHTDFDLMEPTYTHLDLADPHYLVHDQLVATDPTSTRQCHCPLVNHSDACANNSASSGLLTVPSEEMCAWMTADGGFGANSCSGEHRVVHATKRADGGAPRIHFDITSGDAQDLFCMHNSTASITFNSGDGMDEVCVSDMNPRANGTIDVGTGADMVYLVCPLTNMQVTLGQDTDPDLLGIFYQTTSVFMPEWMGDAIENVGPDGPGHKVDVITGGEWQDRIMIKTIA